MEPITREEYYLAKIAGTWQGKTPEPVTIEEYYLATMTGDYSGNTPQPVTRLQYYMAKAAGVWGGSIPAPVTRLEYYWAAIAGKEGHIPDPVTRQEYLLYAISQSNNDVINTASGTTIIINDAAEGRPFLGLRVFGKSTQDGTPSVENPVPIVNAGEGGTINVSISDSGSQSQSLTLATPNGLPGVPVSKDGNYTDADGQQWVCDEIDLERGKYVQRVAIEKNNGGWELKPSSDTPGRFFQHNKLTNIFSIAFKKSLCNIASFTSWGAPVNDKYVFALNGHGIYFSPPKGAEITAEELNAKLNSLSFPVVVVGELATPIERDLTPEEIAAYKALRTYSPTTVITNDAGAGMEVAYVVER